MQTVEIAHRQAELALVRHVKVCQPRPGFTPVKTNSNLITWRSESPMNSAGGNLALLIVFNVKCCTRCSEPRPDATVQQLGRERLCSTVVPLEFRALLLVNVLGPLAHGDHHLFAGAIVSGAGRTALAT